MASIGSQGEGGREGAKGTAKPSRPRAIAPWRPTFPAMTSPFETALAGQFAIERELGRGGMGVVVLARDLMLDRLVALKLLPSGLGAQPEVRERFLREARTAAQLSHPNIVPVHRADEVGGVAFFAMAYVDGESLADRLRDRGPLPPAEAVRVLREVAWALAYAHARGVVHRDVKPENVLLERGTGRALVTDFGIARRAEASRLTQDGHVLGTVHYMSPEQVNDLELDGRSDLYALGVVAYEVLSGRLPFDGLAPAAVLVAHATREPPPLREVAPAVPAALAAVVDRCMAKRPADRYATGEALAEALAQALAASPVDDSRPPGLPELVNEAQASAIWRRAAQLQADQLHRMEARRDLLPRERGVTAANAPAAASDVSISSGYRLSDVMEAAEEAGISRQYVAMALAELPQNGLADTQAAEMGVSEQQATRFLGTGERSLGVSVTVAAPPARVLRALGTVLQQQPYALRLRETVGAHPLDGGIVVFDLPEINWMVATGTLGGTLHWMGTRHQLEATQVQVTLRALPGAPGRTEVTMLCDLRPGVRRNVKWAKGLSALFGAGGAVGAGAMGLAAFAIPALAVLPAAAAGAAVAGGTVAWYRWLYRSTLGKARNEMRHALEAVAAVVQSEEVFGMLPGPTLARDGSGAPGSVPRR